MQQQIIIANHTIFSRWRLPAHMAPWPRLVGGGRGWWGGVGGEGGAGGEGLVEREGRGGEVGGRAGRNSAEVWVVTTSTLGLLLSIQTHLLVYAGLST
ncbi:hypothetical protein BaRGS_00035727 [Batillaria attramentaria]|uniref:Uncharacterized protein n=1 Tax=Batillaria attramentaria TaxID=370345 RepID=A0ABD0JDM5_9CAEN